MQKQRSKPHKRFGLAITISAVIVLISLVTTTAVSVLNYQQYLEAVFSLNATKALQISQLIEDCMSPEEWRDVSDALLDYRRNRLSWRQLAPMAEEDHFTDALAAIQQITDRFMLDGVSVFTIDTEDMARITPENFPVHPSDALIFLMDFYATGSELPTYDLGDTDAWWKTYEDFDAYRQLFTQIIDTHEDETLHETVADGSALLTEYYPIYVDGRFAAMVSVSMNVMGMRRFMDSFFVRTLLIGLGITLALVALAIIFFYYRVVRPLHVMTEEAQQFIANNTAISQRLPSVRTRDELQDLAESFLQMEQDLHGYVDAITTVTAEKEHIRTELSVATKIQEDMLPRVFPPFPNRPEFSIFASMDPAKEVGGDFYDFFFVDHDHFAMIIADVAGKGVPASLFMVITKTLLKNRAMIGGSPAEILHDVNNQLCDGNESSMFVTVWMAILDLTTGQGVAANAGHEHPIRMDVGGEYQLVQYRHSPAIALYEDLKFREHTFELKPGDRLFVYTDGLPEATNANDELFGVQRVLSVLNDRPDAPLNEILPTMTESVAAFVGDAPQFDDLTMLVFEYHGPQA